MGTPALLIPIKGLDKTIPLGSCQGGRGAGHWRGPLLGDTDIHAQKSGKRLVMRLAIPNESELHRDGANVLSLSQDHRKVQQASVDVSYSLKTVLASETGQVHFPSHHVMQT